MKGGGIIWLFNKKWRKQYYYDKIVIYKIIYNNMTDNSKKISKEERREIASMHAKMAFGGRLGSKAEWKTKKKSK